MVKKVYLSMLVGFIGFMAFSQEKQDWNKTTYAREIIASLTSREMHGRGYLNHGDQLAAEYIRTAFQKFGLTPFSAGYYQSFSFPVNTFPGEIMFSISGKHAEKGDSFHGKPGINMLIGAGSKSVDSSNPVVVFDSSFTTSDKQFEKFRKKIRSPATLILIDDREVKDKKKLEYFKKTRSNYFNTAGVIEFTKKLTHTVSQQESAFLTIKLLADSFNIAINNKKRLSAQIKIESNFIAAHSTQNVMAYVSGAIHPDSFIVFSAHYDHLGELGKDIFFPGANDNASGCAMLLNLARYYALPENKPAYSIAFITFAGEEAGLIGSTYYTTHPLFPLSNIRFLLNMDIMGTGDEGITVVNGTVFKNEFEKLVAINKEKAFLKTVNVRGKAANSDHYPFSEKGVKAFFIYTMGGIKAYHDVYDKAETLPLTKFEELFELITQFTGYLQH